MQKKYINVTALVVSLMTLASLLVIFRPDQVLAQIDAFTYFIPIPADDFNDMYDAAVDEEAGGSTCNGINISDEDLVTNIVISIDRDNTIVYYDHWEDGLEVNLTSPSQATTEIWGDNNPANGSPPGLGSDVLSAGDVIISRETVTVPPNTTTPPFFHDGGDKFTAIGGVMAVTLSTWPECAGSLFADAWELYPTDRWVTDYIIPVGEDLVGQFDGFGMTGFSVQAAQPNTIVEFDLDGDGTFGDIPNETLGEGESFTLTSGVNSGARVRTTNPVQVQMLTGDPTEQPSAYEARGFSLIPVSQFTGDLIAPRSSDNGIYWLHNPNGNDISVTATVVGGLTANFTIPSGQTVSFNPTTLVGGGVTGVRFQSAGGEPFYGLVTLDTVNNPNGFQRDWGYALQPVENLTSQVLIGWGVGDNQATPTNDYSRVYVTALAATNIQVDVDNDGVVDATIPVTPLEEVAIIDPTGNSNLSGAFLFSDNNVPFISVWGQDASAVAISPGLDVGTNNVPTPALALQKNTSLVNDADGTGTLSWNDTVRFTIRVYNNSQVDLDPTTVTDQGPNGATYVPGSTTVDGNPVADNGSGTPFPLDGTGLDINLGARSVVVIAYDAVINQNTGGVSNSASASAGGVPPATGTTTLPVKTAAFELDKRVVDPADGVAQRDGLVTYQITITSTGNISITTMPLEDNYDEAQMTFVSANPTEDSNDPVAGTTTWNDLTTTFGPLEPNDVISVTVQMRVGNVPSTGGAIQNTACATGAVGADGSPLPQQCDTAEVTVPPLAAAYVFDKRLISPANGQSDAGQTVTFGLTITSTGNLTITAMTLTDRVNPAHLTFANSSPNPTSNDLTAGATAWDIVGIFGDMIPGRTVNLTVTYTVANPLPAGVQNTTNTATVDGVRDANGGTLPPQTDTATVNFPPPPPTPTPTANNGGDDDDDDDGGNPPPASTPSPTPDPGQAVAFAPPGAPVPGATPTLPVSLLPETGNRDNQAATTLAGLLLLAAVSAIIVFIWSKLKGLKQPLDG